MEINGRTVNLRRTVKTNCILAERAPGKDIRRYPELWAADNYTDSQLSAAFFIYALSEGYEAWKSFQEKDYEPHPLTVDELMSLDEDVFTELFKEALEVYTADGKTTVETQPKRSKKKTGAVKASPSE